MSQQGKGKTNSHIEIDRSVLKEAGRIASRNNTRYPTGKNASKMPDSNPFAVKQPTKAQSQTLYGNPLRPAVNNFISEPNHPQLGGKAEPGFRRGTVSSLGKNRGQMQTKGGANQVGQNDFIEGLTLDKLMFNKQSSDKELEETIEYFSSSDNMSQLNNKDIMRKHLERVVQFFEGDNWKEHEKAQAMVETADSGPFMLMKGNDKRQNSQDDELRNKFNSITRKIQEYKAAEARQSSRVATRQVHSNQDRPINTALVNSQRRKVTSLENATTHKASSSKVYLTSQELALRKEELKLRRVEIAHEKQQLLILEERKKAQKAEAQKAEAEKIAEEKKAEAQVAQDKAEEAKASDIEFDNLDSFITKITDTKSINTNSNEGGESSSTLSVVDTDKTSKEELAKIHQEINDDSVKVVEEQQVVEADVKQEVVAVAEKADATKKKQLIMKI